LAGTVRAFGQLGAALLPVVPTRGPMKSSQVDAGWLTAHFGSSNPGAAVTSVAPMDGTSGTTDRRRLHVEWNDAGRRAGLPATVYVKSTPLSAKNRTMVASLDMAVNEVRFYKAASSSFSEHVPAFWFGYAGIGARHLLLLEDLTAQDCRPFALADDCGINHARALIDALAKLHATFWESDRLKGDLSFAKRWSDRPGYAVLKSFYRKGRIGALKLALPEATPEVRRLAAAMASNEDAFYRQFELGPLTLLHGDSHLGNTYAYPDGRAGLLDWQVVWQGPGLREVSYFITTGLEPDVRRAHARDLVDRYLEGLRAYGISDLPSSDEAFDRYRIFSAEAWDATAMTVSWPGLQAPENMAAGWRRSCLAVEDNEAASLIEKL